MNNIQNCVEEVVNKQLVYIQKILFYTQYYEYKTKIFVI